MKSIVPIFVLAAVTLAAPQGGIGELKGTWSGNWTIKGSVPEAMTVELKEDEKGAFTGRFLSPVAMDFSKASFNSKTGAVTFEATDPKSNKQYRVNATLKGTELNGTLQVDGTSAEMRLIKWTFFGW
jgi:hypothetical protein